MRAISPPGASIEAPCPDAAMSFKDQLRDYVVGLWRDFWSVSPQTVLSVLGCIALAIGILLLRLHTVLSYPAWFRPLSPVFSLFLFLLFGYILYRRPR